MRAKMNYLHIRVRMNCTNLILGRKGKSQKSKRFSYI